MLMFHSLRPTTSNMQPPRVFILAWATNSMFLSEDLQGPAGGEVISSSLKRSTPLEEEQDLELNPELKSMTPERHPSWRTQQH